MYATKEMIKDTTSEKTIFSNIEVLELREKFATEYCVKKGWDKSNLSIEQVLEIRNNNEWHNPGLIKA